ncbi:MAG TPA: CmcJ/NvfI family oxidoreductase [Novosphingobium sp.]
MADSIRAAIAYVRPGGPRPCYYANAHERDRVPVTGRSMLIANARSLSTGLDREGFVLADHSSRIGDFTDPAEVAATYPAEIVELLLAQTGADRVFVTAPAILRFSEATGAAGSRDNSHPARFAHIDATAATSAALAARALPAGLTARRHAHYNVWRAISGAPQDVPLALCDARSLAPDDCIVADAIFDPPGVPQWRFESWVIAPNPAHRWHWYPDLTRDEAIIFKSSDSRFGNPVPHVAFDAPPEWRPALPRISIEMRAVAYWLD